MAEELEQTLSQLMVPDSNVIQQATQQLKNLVKDPNIVPALCLVIAASQNAQVRQYAAVLLRRRIMKARQWRALPEDFRNSLRTEILQVLLNEKDKSVKKAVAQVVATISRHTLPKDGWPELFQFLQQYTTSSASEQREVGLYVLSTVASAAAEQLKPHVTSLLELCSRTLQDTSNHMIPFYSIECLTHLVPIIGSDESKVFQTMIPGILFVIQSLIQVDQEKAVEAMEILDELLECEVGVIVPHLKTVIEFCLQTAGNKELESSLRIKALSFVSWLAQLKRKSILKMKLTESILDVLFPILCEVNKDDEDDDEFEESESQNPSSFAAQVIDVLGQNLPPEKYIPQLMKYVDPALQSEVASVRRAGYMSMAVTAEGCADYIRTKLLQQFLQSVYHGLSDKDVTVRGAALFALGQFSEHLQPDISKFSSELLPKLFESLSKSDAEPGKEQKVVTKTYYALEMFCENLGKDILPYLPQLMQYLLNTINTATNPHAKELAISAIGATANAAKEDIVPFFPQIMELLKGFLAPTKDEGELKVQVQALDTLGVFARTMGEHFRPLAKECLQTGLNLSKDAEDPDLKRCIYGLTAALSTLLKAEMAPLLQPLVRQMLESIKSTEGVTAHYAEEESQMFKIFEASAEETIDGDDEEEEEDEPEGFSVENSYLEEKEDACCALGELAVNTGVVFLPYIEEVYKEITELLEYPASSIRRSSVTSVGQLCCAVCQAAHDTKSADAITALNSMLHSSMPAMLRLAREDTDRQVAMVTLEALRDVMEKVKAPALQGGGGPDNVISLVKDVLQHKVACQDNTDDEEINDEQAEYDQMLVENAGELVPSVAKIIGGEAFVPYLEGLLPEFLKRLKNTSTVPERSFAVGTLAEILEACGTASAVFTPHLYPIIMNSMKDEDEEVRSNSVYAMGVIASNGSQVLHTKYPDILKELFDMLSREKDRRVIDNICGATCRLIWTNMELVPLDQVLPVLLQCLPLQKDHEENSTIFPCLAQLYKTANPQLLSHLPQTLNIMGQVLGTEEITEEMQTLLVDMVRDVSQKYPDVLQKVMSSADEQTQRRLQTCLSTCNGS